MSSVQDVQDQWAEERGAIEQEVSRDLSSPEYKLRMRLSQDLFAGTPYQIDPLGTKESFDKTTAAMLKEFHDKWYAPNNAILIITGDVDPVSTLEKIKKYYGAIPRHAVPERPAVNLQPVKRDSFTLDSNLEYTLTTVAFRFPGTSSPDFAAANILSDVLSSQRANLYALVPAGKALGAGFQLLEGYPKAAAALAYAAVPPDADPTSISSELQKIIADYAAYGVPSDLVDAARKGEIAGSGIRPELHHQSCRTLVAGTGG